MYHTALQCGTHLESCRGGGRGGGVVGGPDPRTFENRGGRPPDSRMKGPKSGVFPIFRVFWGRLATLSAIRPPLKNPWLRPWSY